jgi:putative transposase
MLSLLLVALLNRLDPALAASYFENLAVHQQLAVLDRKTPRPRLHPSDRLFWVLISSFWPNWRDALAIVKPATVIGRHRKGFRLFWTWKSRPRRCGRPSVSREVRDLIRRMCRENPLWSAPRIHGELLKLGFDVSERTVSRYILHHPKPPSQSWRTFLENHVGCLASMDLFVVPTAAFRLLYGFIILRHDRRRIVQFGVTEHPTAIWIAQQITEAFPWDTAPRYMIRDRDGVYGKAARERLAGMGIKEVLTAPRSPWQSPYVERVIGLIRRDCLDHVIVWNERHLRLILASYLTYYHHSRCHLSLDKDTPHGRSVQAVDSGNIVAFPQVAASITATSGARPEPALAYPADSVEVKP